MYGQGNISYNEAVLPGGGGGGTVTGALDGLMLDGANVKWGQTVGLAGNPAKLLENREIDFNAFTFGFKNARVLYTSPQNVTHEFHPAVNTFEVERIFTNSGNNLMPFQRLVDGNPNGGPPDDNVYIQGWNIDSRYSISQPSWTSRMEYRYVGSFYEYHDPQWSSADGSRLYRLQSFTFQDSGVDSSHDQNLIFYMATAMECRNMMGNHFWSVSNNIGTAPDVTNMVFSNRAGTKQATHSLNDALNYYSIGNSAGALALEFLSWSNYIFQYKDGHYLTFGEFIAGGGWAFTTPIISSDINLVTLENPIVYTQGDNAMLQFTPGSGGGAVRGYINVNQGVGWMNFHVQAGGYYFYFDLGGAAGLTINGNGLTTADPGAGAVPWQLGNVAAAAVALDAAHYVQVKINGAVVKLAIVV